MTKDKALKLALAVLESLPGFRADIDDAIDVIKSALAQPDHIVDANKMAQPVQGPTSAVRTLQRLGYTDHGGELWKPPLGSIPAWAQPVQEPDELTIAYMSGLYDGKKKRPWVGLTDEEIQQSYEDAYKVVQGRRLEVAFARVVEAKLKGKNFD